MASFSDFDTDYSGVSRFQDIMNNGGNVDPERLRDFISRSAGELADGGKDTITHIDFGNGLWWPTRCARTCFPASTRQVLRFRP